MSFRNSTTAAGGSQNLWQGSTAPGGFIFHPILNGATALAGPVINPSAPTGATALPGATLQPGSTALPGASAAPGFIFHPLITMGATAAAVGTTGSPGPPPIPMLTLGDQFVGKDDHRFKVEAAKKALKAIPVNYIQGVNRFLDGTSTQEHNIQLFENLSKFAKAYDVGIGFHNDSNQADVAVSNDGVSWLMNDDPQDGTTMVQGYPGGMPNSIIPLYIPRNVQVGADEYARVREWFKNSSAFIDTADTDVTDKPIENEVEQESVFSPKKKINRVYAKYEHHGVRHTNPVSGKTTTTNYTHVVTKLAKAIGSGHLLVAQR